MLAGVEEAVRDPSWYSKTDGRERGIVGTVAEQILLVSTAGGGGSCCHPFSEGRGDDLGVLLIEWAVVPTSSEPGMGGWMDGCTLCLPPIRISEARRNYHADKMAIHAYYVHTSISKYVHYTWDYSHIYQYP